MELAVDQFGERRSSPSGKAISWKIFNRSMCSIMCREFGFSGECRSQVNQVNSAKAPITDKIRLAMGEFSPVNTRPSFSNSIRTPRLVRFCTMSQAYSFLFDVDDACSQRVLLPRDQPKHE